MWHVVCLTPGVNTGHESDTADSGAIVDEILAYLKAHPQAADTREGIVQWWLIHSRYLRGLAQVDSALQLLIQRGQVIERTRADAPPLYFAADQIRDR